MYRVNVWNLQYQPSSVHVCKCVCVCVQLCVVVLRVLVQKLLMLQRTQFGAAKCLLLMLLAIKKSK